MCGIVFAASDRPVEAFVRAAHARQIYRGPDSGSVSSEVLGSTFVSMAHERLAILDLSERGAQPMASASARSVIIFNGEIYNYRELAKRHGLAPLRSGTDTEVAVELIERLGIEAASREFNGMWAIAVLDRQRGRVYLSRDRLGKKPIYHVAIPGGVAIASEMHSLLLHPDVEAQPDLTVAARFLSRSLMDIDERSWVSGILSLPAACVAEINLARPAAGLQQVRSYWAPRLDPDSVDRRPRQEQFAELRELVRDSVALRMHADVPVGIALSGGLDSSIMAALANRVGGPSDELRLLSATSPGHVGDESAHARAMAEHLGRKTHEFSIAADSGEALFNWIRICTQHNDGPVASFSNVLFYKLMECAKSMGLTVVLTGQGADEAFCGYKRYPILEVKRRLASGRLASAVGLGAQLLRHGTVLDGFKLPEARRYLGRANAVKLGPSVALGPNDLGHFENMAEYQWRDISSLSVPYLCHYEDRMSMAWSCEVRSPFLDYRVIEAGLRMPVDFKLAEGWTKAPLRQAFADVLPHDITWRRDKKGFTSPQDDWLRKELRPYVMEALDRPDAEVYRLGLVDRSSYVSCYEQYCRAPEKFWFREFFAPFAVELWLQALQRRQLNPIPPA